MASGQWWACWVVKHFCGTGLECGEHNVRSALDTDFITVAEERGLYRDVGRGVHFRVPLASP